MPATSSAPGSQPQAVADKNRKRAVKQAAQAVKPVAKATAKAVTTATQITEAASSVGTSVSRGTSAPASPAKSSRPRSGHAHPEPRLKPYKPPKPVAVKVRQDLKTLPGQKAQKAASNPIRVGPHLTGNEIRVTPHKTVVSPHIARRAVATLPKPVRQQAAQKLRAQKPQVPQKPKQQTPKAQRKAVKAKLKEAAKKSVPKGGTPTGPLTEGQKQFAKTLSKKTGIDPRVIGAWELKEESWDYAKGYEQANYNNWLNIQPAQVGGSQSVDSHDPRFDNPKSAAKLTAKFIQGDPDTPGGGASPELASQIQALRGKSPEEQAAGIANSVWGTGDISGTLPLVGESKSRPGTPIPHDLRQKAKDVLGDRKAAKVIARAKNPGGTSAGPLPGPLSGSKTVVQKLVGSKVHGDHGVKNEGTVHTPGGDHYDPHSYAQDINSPSGNPSEGEPPYNQATLNKIVKNARKFGFKDIPHLTIGQNYEGTAKGYRLQLLTNEGGTVNHIHVGVRYEGATATAGQAVTGTAAGVATGTTAPGAPAAPTTSHGQIFAQKGKRSKKRRRKRRRRTPLPPVSLSLPAPLNPADYLVKPSTESYSDAVKAAPIRIDL